MNVLEGLPANYQGKVLARAIRAVKEQGREEEEWRSIGSDFTWTETKEGRMYWESVMHKDANPDQYLPSGYVDAGEVTEFLDLLHCEIVDTEQSGSACV